MLRFLSVVVHLTIFQHKPAFLELVAAHRKTDGEVDGEVERVRASERDVECARAGEQQRDGTGRTCAAASYTPIH